MQAVAVASAHTSLTVAVHLSEMNSNGFAIGRRKQNLQIKEKSENIHICVANICLAADRDQIVPFIPNNEQNSIKYLIHNETIGNTAIAILKDIKLPHWEYSLAVNATAPLFLTQQLIYG